jgi:hypothetical protein
VFTAQLTLFAYKPRSSACVFFAFAAYTSRFLAFHEIAPIHHSANAYYVLAVIRPIYPTGRRWVPILQLCLACDTKRKDTDALRHAQNSINDDNGIGGNHLGARLLDSPFAFLLDVSAVKFMLHSIYKIQPNQLGVNHAKGGIRERCSGCFELKKKRGNTFSMQTTVTNYLRLAKAVVTSTTLVCGSNVKLLTQSG